MLLIITIMDTSQLGFSVRVQDLVLSMIASVRLKGSVINAIVYIDGVFRYKDYALLSLIAKIDRSSGLLLDLQTATLRHFTAQIAHSVIRD
jgi:hypothetical protein